MISPNEASPFDLGMESQTGKAPRLTTDRIATLDETPVSYTHLTLPTTPYV